MEDSYSNYIQGDKASRISQYGIADALNPATGMVNAASTAASTISGIIGKIGGGIVGLVRKSRARKNLGWFLSEVGPKKFNQYSKMIEPLVTNTHKTFKRYMSKTMKHKDFGTRCAAFGALYGASGSNTHDMYDDMIASTYGGTKTLSYGTQFQDEFTAMEHGCNYGTAESYFGAEQFDDGGFVTDVAPDGEASYGRLGDWFRNLGRKIREAFNKGALQQTAWRMLDPNNHDRISTMLDAGKMLLASNGNTTHGYAYGDSTVRFNVPYDGTDAEAAIEYGVTKKKMRKILRQLLNDPNRIHNYHLLQDAEYRRKIIQLLRSPSFNSLGRDAARNMQKRATDRLATATNNVVKPYNEGKMRNYGYDNGVENMYGTTTSFGSNLEEVLYGDYATPAEYVSAITYGVQVPSSPAQDAIVKAELLTSLFPSETI